MGQNFHICLRSGPRGLTPTLPLTVSLTVKYTFFFYVFPNCTTVAVSERLSSNCKDCLIISHRISFIDKMKSSIWEICCGSTWFWRIYIWRDICRAHEFDRLIRRAIIRRNRSKHNMDMGRILQKTNLSFAFSHKGHTMVEVGLACLLCCIYVNLSHIFLIWGSLYLCVTIFEYMQHLYFYIFFGQLLVKSITVSINWQFITYEWFGKTGPCDGKKS